MSENGRTRVDWDALRPHYEAGVRSLKEIGKEFDCSDAAIVKHAKSAGWTRCLKAKIQAKADAKVAAALVAQEAKDSPAGRLTEAVRVEVEAEVQARIRIEHRTDIQRFRKLVMGLLDELEEQSDSESLDRLRDLVMSEPDPDDKAGRDRFEKLKLAFDRATSLGGRTKTIKDLSDVLKTLVALEREAFGIDKVLPETPQDFIDPVEGARRLAFALARADSVLSQSVH